MNALTKFGFIGSLVLAAVLGQDAHAIPVGDNSLYESLYDVTFDLGIGSAEVDCEVYEYTSGDYQGKYIYQYEISNVDSDVPISFFSVGISDQATAYDPNFESTGSVAPTSWTCVMASGSSHVESISALFANPALQSGGAYSDSVPLWFASDNSPTTGSAVLFGKSSGVPYYASQELLTPVPEPTTIILLGIGGLLTVTRKKISVNNFGAKAICATVAKKNN